MKRRTGDCDSGIIDRKTVKLIRLLFGIRVGLAQGVNGGWD
jgi:hypothetical protein